MIRTNRALISAVVLAATSVLCQGAEAQFPAESTRMVNVMGLPVRVLTLGLESREEGQPVLFLNSGAGSALESWGGWVSQIAELAPVVAYERPGLGESVFDDEPPTLARVVAHAHEVMQVLGVPPPYVLVGHSWAGPIILQYAGSYPDEVVGMVYLDPTEPDLSPSEYLLASDEAERAARRSELDSWIAGRDMSPGMLAEQRVIAAFQDRALADRHLPSDPEVPTAFVLGLQVAPAGPGQPAFFDDTYREELVSGRLRRFAVRTRERRRGTLLVATDAGHFVHLDAPGLAEQAVRRVLFQLGEFVVPEDVLATYVGEYELRPTFSIVVTLEDGALFVRGTGQSRLPIFATSETEFFLRVVDAQITFETGTDGTVSGLVLHQGGRDSQGRKVR